MKFAVLGLGPSLNLFKPSQDVFTIGVNDIWRLYKSNIVLCMDTPNSFTPERIKAIHNCKPDCFYSQLPDYASCYNYERIDLINARGSLVGFPKKLPISNNSTYTATALAAKLGATSIELYGVDFIDHPHLSNGANLKTLVLHFEELFKFLTSKGVEVNVNGKGPLTAYNSH